MSDITPFLKELLSAPGLSGHEDPAAEIIRRMAEVIAERDGFRFVAANEATTRQMVGFGYGYTGQPGQWWYDTVAAAMGEPLARVWLADCYEFVEMAVLPVMQGYGIGGRLHDAVFEHERAQARPLARVRGRAAAPREPAF